MTHTHENRSTRVKLKKASAQASSRYTIGGKAKNIPPKPITLPKLKCLEDKE